MSRRPQSDQQFGSDSFLDVIANIVGILIILIVIAGLKVSQSPMLRKAAPSYEPANPVAEELAAAFGDDLPLEPLITEEEDLPLVSSPAPQFVPEPPTEEPALLEPPRELVGQVRELAAEVGELEQGIRSAQELAASARQSQLQLAQRLAQTQEQNDKVKQKRQQLLEERERRRTSFEQLHTTAAVLLEQIDAEVKKAPLVETLQHRVTPLSKEVVGMEQHYRLAGNRVSEVPIAALSVRLKDQMERRKEWLLKQRSSQGEVGPLGGYVMSYVVQRDNVGVMDEVRYGQGMVRISVTNWRIEAAPGLAAETADEALTPGSQFYESLIAADEGTTLTFWVYPDSYGAYRRVQKFAHEHGFLVAGRPLPQGIPISGSPSGSKSAGQ